MMRIEIGDDYYLRVGNRGCPSGFGLAFVDLGYFIHAVFEDGELWEGRALPVRDRDDQRLMDAIMNGVAGSHVLGMEVDDAAD